MKGKIQMKNYFTRDYSIHPDDLDFCTFLKKKYDEADDIFEKRFEELENKKDHKTKKIEGLIDEIYERIYEKKECGIEDEKDVFPNKSKMISLVLGNMYLRLAQCQNEVLVKSRENYQKALTYFEEHIDYLNTDEIDLLLMLNKGKYFRNTAEVGKKSDYERALSIFCDVAKSVEKVDICNEKKFHLLLDAKINMGRVSRYSYDFDYAWENFLSLILTLEPYIDTDIKEQLYDCEELRLLLNKVSPDNDVKKYIQSVRKEEVSLYIDEYLLQSLIHIGIICRKKKEYKKAKKIFELITDIDKNGEGNIDAQNNLGVCCRKLGYLEGRMTSIGRDYYAEAEKIFSKLKDKGNKFAFINFYKCKLCYDENKCKNEISELIKKKEELDNSYHLQLLLGKLYMKTKEYGEAKKWFESVYRKKSHISRGSLGFKAYYNLAQCNIRMGNFRQARNILKEIGELLKKNHDYTDLLTEIDYAWCLMQEGNYSKAKRQYQKLLDCHKSEIGKKHLLMINNNLTDCYIHLGEWEKAKIYIKKVLEIENDNCTAAYFSGIILLNDLLTDKSTNYEAAYNQFDKLIGQKGKEIGVSSGWLISAMLLYKQNRDDELKENIIKRIRYSSDSISMKSYFYLADFVLQLLEERKEVYNALYRDFCHIKLIERNENQAFEILKSSMEFHFFDVEKRAFILANIVLMYEYILDIKSTRLLTRDKYKLKLPYHYTKLNTLNCLLTGKNDEKPKLRLWNSTYMNDAYEGKFFDQLLYRATTLKNGIEEESDISKAGMENAVNIKLQMNSNVYITSFSTEENSFQMWSIYGDNEKGAAIKFDDDFFDIGDKYQDVVMDSIGNEYALYEVKYLDMDHLQNESELMKKLNGIWEHMSLIEKKLEDWEPEEDTDEYISFKNAASEVKTFIADRVNEVRFLFKTKSYEYEKELRLIKCSHHPKVDNKNFDIPRLYIDVERNIENLDIKIGSKLENQQIKDLYVWLKNTGKVKHIEVSDINRLLEW